MSPPRVISAPDTVFAKLGVPLLILAGALFMGLMVGKQFAHSEPLGRVLLQLVAAVGVTGSALPIAWMCVRLKRVTLDDASLRVSNLLREIEVPLREVERVDQIRGLTYRIVVRLTRDTAFGRKIDSARSV